MLISGSGGQPRGGGGRVQAGSAAQSGVSGLRASAAPWIVTGLLLTGCASVPSSLNPVSWWHNLQGGKIAEDRPPPPGADQPYPNLASVPAKPAEPDRAAMANLANALIADRANAQRQAAAAPVPDPSSPTASPALFGKGTVRHHRPCHHRGPRRRARRCRQPRHRPPRRPRPHRPGRRSRRFRARRWRRRAQRRSPQRRLRPPRPCLQRRHRRRICQALRRGVPPPSRPWPRLLRLRLLPAPARRQPQPRRRLHRAVRPTASP